MEENYMDKQDFMNKINDFKNLKSCATCKNGKLIDNLTRCIKLSNCVVDTTKDMPCKGNLWEFMLL